MVTEEKKETASRRHWIGISLLLVTVFSWGLGLPAMRYGLTEWPPLSFRGSAAMIASLCLAVVALLRGEDMSVPRPLYGRLIVASLINVFAWLGFPAIALVWLNVGEAAPLFFSMPIWTMLLSWVLLGTAPNLRNVFALALGITGICVLFALPSADLDTHKLIGAGFALAGSILFALGVVTTRQALPLPPVTMVAWQLGLGSLPMLAIGIIYERPHFSSLSLTGWLLLIFVALVTTALAFLSWFAALRRLPPTTAAIATLMVPVVGVISAALLLGEPITLREVLALALTLSGAGLSLKRT